MSIVMDALSCREFVDVILSYLDGELDPRRRELFEEHIRACPACFDYLDSYRRTVAMTGTAWDGCGADDTVPEEVPEELVRAVLAARGRS